MVKNAGKPAGCIKHMIAIGASTGGPKSLQEVIPLIPCDASAVVFIAQHMPPMFTRSLAERLNSMSEMLVKEAENNETVMAGRIYIAPGDYHMLIERTGENHFKICLSQDPPVNGHRPSIDVMMESIAKTRFPSVVGVIMSGMGRDGSTGIRMLKKENNGYIIAQDENSCIVYGMPRFAIETGSVDVVLPLKDIAKEIIKYFSREA